MRVRQNRDNSARVWLNTDEYEHDFLPAAESYDRALVCRLGAEVGLRASEIVNVKIDHISEARTVSDNPELPNVIEGTLLRVPRAKDTRSGTDAGGKSREAFLPSDVRKEIVRFANDRGIEDDDYLFGSADGSGFTKRWARKCVKQVAEAAAAETGDERFELVSSHDMRRYYATTMLQKRGLNPEVLMRVGGWEDYSALKPYLRDPTDDVVLEEFARIGQL